MSRAAATSISTRLTAPAPDRKNRRRTTPVTSTTSPTRHDATVRRLRPLHTAQSSASTVARDADVDSARGTTTRNVQSGSPLGSVRNAGSWERRPISLTWLTHSSGSDAELCEGDLVDTFVAFDVVGPFVRADMHLTSASYVHARHRQNRLRTRCHVEETPLRSGCEREVGRSRETP
jgi:hypothetical protein